MNIFINKNEILITKRYPTNFIRKLQTLNKKDMVGVEIGVFKGLNAYNILNTLSISKLYLIDPYQDYDNYLEGKKAGGEIIANDCFNQAKKYAERILKKFNNKEFILKKSSDAVSDIKEQLDFAYIDGNHAYEYVLADIENYYPLVKAGGIIGGDDFENDLHIAHQGVVKAVLEFCTKNNILNKLKLVGTYWWIEK